MRDLQTIGLMLNSNPNIQAKLSKDLLDEPTIIVELINLKNRNDHTKVLNYILDHYPEIFINHAFNGFSGTEFEYKLTATTTKS